MRTVSLLRHSSSMRATYFLSRVHQVLKHQSYRYIVSRPSPFVYKAKIKNESEAGDAEFSSLNITDYLKQRGLTANEIAAIPNKALKRTINTTHLILIDRLIAKLIALTICSRASGEHVLEFDAGIGLMSEILLRLSPNLRLYVPYSSMAEYLENKFQNDPENKVRVFDRTFTNLLGILYAKVPVPDAFSNLVVGLPKKPWDEDIPVTMIVPITHLKFMKSLVSTLVSENSLKQFGRPEFFFLMPSSVAKPLLFRDSCKLRQIPIHYLFHIFFDVHELLSDIPREAFLPWPPTRKKKMSDENLYLIHAIPKLERFEPYLDSQFINILLTFVRNAVCQRKRIIPLFESFVPYCGARFIIEDDLDVYTEFQEITPEKFYSVFKKLTSYPEFDKKMMDKNERESLENDSDSNSNSDSDSDDDDDFDSKEEK